jgi:hypothetical protein
MSTMFVIGSGAASRAAVATWPTISAGRRFRTRPICAVAQNVQPIPQPAWLEMQRVRRSRAPPARSVCGMSTLSIDAARFVVASGGSANSIFRVPSLAFATWLGSMRPIENVSARRRRKGRLRFDIASKSAAPRRWTQLRTWAARYRGSPASAHQRSSPARSRSCMSATPMAKRRY